MRITIICLKIFGALLIIFATYIITVVIVDTDREISDIEEKIVNFKDARIAGTMGILSYENRDTIAAVHDVEYYQMLNLKYLLELKNKRDNQEKYKEQIEELEKTMRKTQEIILDNNIDLTIRWSTLLSENKEDGQATRDATKEIRANKELSMPQKIKKIREIEEENKKIFGGRLARMHEKWFENMDIKKRLDKVKLLWQGIFIWIQIGGLSMLAIAGAIEGITKIQRKG